MIRLAWLYLRLGIQNEMQYRANFFVQLLQSVIAIGVSVTGLLVIFSYTNQLKGWGMYQILAVMGVYTLMGGFVNAIIQPNMQQLLADIQQGTLDFALLKPVDSQGIVSVRVVRIWNFVDVFAGAVVLVIALLHLQQNISALRALAFAAALVMGGLLLYCFLFIITTTAFWFIRMENILQLFEGLYQTGRFPVTVYPNWLRYGLTFLIPIAFAVTVPSQSLIQNLSASSLLIEAGLLVIFAFITRIFWSMGIHRYSGASA